jgi:hypothetical protein
MEHDVGEFSPDIGGDSARQRDRRRARAERRDAFAWLALPLQIFSGSIHTRSTEPGEFVNDDCVPRLVVGGALKVPRLARCGAGLWLHHSRFSSATIVESGATSPASGTSNSLADRASEIAD